MEEAPLDHGIDRLPFLVAFLLLIIPTFSQATSFGPMTISNQVDNARYFTRGRVVGGSWVAEERQTKRPYTYWKVQVTGQLKGASLGPEVTVRQPGGEIGEMGYHVAGTATFKEGEEVFLALRETSETAKEITGLASGKYSVERGANGEPVVRSALGFDVKDTEGRPFSPEGFAAFVRKIASGNANEEERNVFLNKDVTHDHSPEVDRGVEEAKRLMKANTAAVTGVKESPSESPAQSESSPQETPAQTEEQTGSSSTVWVVAGVILGFLFIGIWFFRRR
ncbi:MAG: LPXTG cell wall anchor domain-containing protein [Proteobacteria bacterium]|nr:MAG: LPXTG cell wall anchor domain-containing protein [Pseudomonadota bacterium]